MSHTPFVHVPFRFSLALVTLLSVGCTIDFEEEFSDYTEEGIRRRMMQAQDMTPVPVDMMPLPDMDPPPPIDMMPPPPVDTDGDGVIDEMDNCPELPNPDQRDDNGNMIGDACDDRDGDGVLDYRYDPEAPEPYAPYDNCVDALNPDQSDLDWDGVGDACDQDLDGDGLDVIAEEMRGTNPLKADSDRDGVRDDLDLCPLVTSRDNRDLDNDGYGDECDTDDDGDGVLDWFDVCPYAPNPEQTLAEGSSRGVECLTDADSDGVPDAEDPCPFEPQLAEGAGAATCELGLQRWGFDGDVYNLAFNGAYDTLWAATRGGLRTISDDPAAELSFGEESGLWSRYVKRVVPTQGSLVSAWLMSSSAEGLNALRWDSTLGQYRVSALPLEALGFSGSLNAITAYNDTLYLGGDEGLYELSPASEGLISLELPAPAQPVSALAISGEGADLWCATGATLYHLSAERVVSAVGTYEQAGAIKGIKPLSDGSLALLGERATLIISQPTPELPSELLQTISYPAYDVSERPDGLYLATSEGVRFVDQRGRAYEPNVKQVGSALTRTLAHNSTNNRAWVGAEGSTTELYGLWHGLSVPEETCVRDLYLEAGAYWWVATNTGLSSVSPDGSKTTHAQGSFYELARDGAGVWSANDTSVVYADRAGGALTYPLPPELTPPVTAVSRINDQLWLGGQSSIAYTTLSNNAPSNWTTLQAQENTNFPTGVVKGFYLQDNYVRVGVEGNGAGQTGGLLRFNLNNGTFDATPYTSINGGVPSFQVNDFSGEGENVAVSTNLGARVYQFVNQLPSTSNLSANAGLPGESGSSDVLTLTFTPSYSFLMVRPNALQPYGALLRFARDGVENPLDLTQYSLYSSAYTDPLTTPVDELSRARLRSELSADEGYPYVSLATCGSELSPGKVTLLDAEGGVRQRVPERALKTPSERYALIPSPGRHLTWAQSYVGAEGEVSLYLTDLATVDPNNLNLGEPRERRAVSNITKAIRQCESYKLQAGDPTSRVECLLDDNYVATNLNESWNQGAAPLFDGQPFEVRDFVIDLSQLAAGRWYATNQGLVQKRGNNFLEYTNASTQGGLPSDNLYSVAYNLSEGRVYVGMDIGVVSFPVNTGSVNIPVEAWTVVEGLKGVKVYDLAVDAITGEVWAATAYGLAKISPAGVSRYGLAQGLPAEKITQVRVGQDSVVYALHESGLSIYQGGAWRHFGPQQGVYQATDLQVVEPAQPGESRYVWVGGPLGASRLKVE